MWAMGGIDHATSLALYFEVASAHAGAVPTTKRRFLQVRRARAW